MQKSFRLSTLILMALIAIALPLCATHEPPSEEEAGWTLVKERCYLCHYLDRSDVKFGPSLKALFQRKRLMNGRALNDHSVSAWIAEGSANMPAFRHTLTPREIKLIVKFLKTNSASNIPMLQN